MSVFPKDTPAARRGVVRARFEKNLRFVRGRIDTSGSASILQGVGFTVVRNGNGDITITFDPPFSAILSATATVEGSGTIVVRCEEAPTASTIRFVAFNSATGVAEDRIIQFTAVGPS